MLNISITGDEPADGDAEAPIDVDDTPPDGDIDQDIVSELYVEPVVEDEVEICDIEGVDEDGAESPADGDAFESESPADGDDYEQSEAESADGDDVENATDGDTDNNADGDAEYGADESSMEDGDERGDASDGDDWNEQQTTESSGGCNLPGAPQGAAFVLLGLLLFAYRRRSAR